MKSNYSNQRHLRYVVFSVIYRLLDSVKGLRFRGRSPAGRLQADLTALFFRKYAVQGTSWVETRYGFKMLCGLDDSTVAPLLFRNGYEDAESGVVAGLLKRGDVFLDVGANHGYYSLLAGKMVGETGAVYSFEPQEVLCGRILESARANSLNNIIIHCIAVGHRRGTLKLKVPSHSSGQASLSRTSLYCASKEEVSVPVVDLDSFTAHNSIRKVNMMKVDVEGHELHVFQGAKGLLEAQRPILMFELGTTQCQAGGYSTKELLNYLRKYGYHHFRIRDNALIPIATCDKPPGIGAWNILCVIPELHEIANRLPMTRVWQ